MTESPTHHTESQNSELKTQIATRKHKRKKKITIIISLHFVYHISSCVYEHDVVIINNQFILTFLLPCLGVVERG